MNDSFHRSILENLYDGVYFVDRERHITYWNKGAERLSGYQADEVLGSLCTDHIIMHLDDRGEKICEVDCPIRTIMNNQTITEKELYLRHKNGHLIPVQVRATPIFDDNSQVLGAVEIFSDNSSKIAALQTIRELEQMAFLDPLTGAGNRRYTETALTEKINEMKRYGWPFGVLFIDIDNFKQVNDRHGHHIGDEVLKMVARTLMKNTRSYDFIGRWGGEEFIAIIVNVTEEQLISIAEKFRFLVEQCGLAVGSNAVKVTVSIGASMIKSDDKMTEVVDRADKLMYQSKKAGKNLVTIG